MKVFWDDYSQSMDEKICSKPPSRKSRDPQALSWQVGEKRYPLGICYIAIEDCHSNSYPLKVVIFHSRLLVYHKVCHNSCHDKGYKAYPPDMTDMVSWEIP